jgi:hypothetical protein
MLMAILIASRRAPKGALVVSLSFSHDSSRRLIKGSNDGGRGGPVWALVPPKIRKKKIRSKKIYI